MKRLSCLDIFDRTSEIVDNAYQLEFENTPGRGGRVLVHMTDRTVDIPFHDADLFVGVDEFAARHLLPALLPDLTCLSCGACVRVGGQPCGH
ncbi:hypothetical protein [Burkholderia vietnamiensis]|uniref:hypothetical protein n=1 Tax=Burkholderia vietnamiensis TaxID=60552 RepID=UPI0015932098|nr:hypothetical protein [Burkholderia vietnamiensis]